MEEMEVVVVVQLVLLDQQMEEVLVELQFTTPVVEQVLQGEKEK